MGLGSGVRDQGSRKNLFRIPDPGVKKAPDSGSRIRIRNTAVHCTVIRKPSVSKSVIFLLSCSFTAILCVPDVWEEGNCQLVRFEPPPGQVTPDEELLATTYPLPQPSTFHLTQVVGSAPLPPKVSGCPVQ